MSWENETDILDIHNRICSEFQKDVKNLELYKASLTELELSYNEPGKSVRIKNELTKSIEALKSKIEKIESKTDYYFYISEVAEILTQYQEILKTPIKMSFLGRPKPESNKQKALLAQKYLSIAQKYTSYLPVKKEVKKEAKPVCENCGGKDFTDENALYICVDCGVHQHMAQFSSSYKDVDRVNITSKYTYDRKVHFRDCINQYQGKQNCTIDNKIYESLETTFKNYGLLVESDDRLVKFGNITKKHVLMFLKELGFAKHYENVNLIYYTISGKKPDDISHLEEKLLSDFDLLVETYDKNFKKDVDRVNFISTQFVLYQLLRKYKHPCKKEDFVILKTMDRQSFHDDICSQLFSMLGWSYNSIC